MPTRNQINNAITAYVADYVRDLMPHLNLETRAKMIEKVKEGKPLLRLLGLRYREVKAIAITGLEAAEMKRRLP